MAEHGRIQNDEIKKRNTHGEKKQCCAEPFDATTVVQEETEAKYEAERRRPWLVIFTGESRTGEGATGYAVTWKKEGTQGPNMMSMYDAAIARALETAARRRKKLGHLTIFTDAQAAIRGMTPDDPRPGRKYAIADRKHVAELRCREPEISIEIRWCPSHCEIEGNEKADEWAKLAADEPDSHGVV